MKKLKNTSAEVDNKQNEINYLYEMEGLLEDSDISFREFFEKVVELIEKACHKRSKAMVKVAFRDLEFCSIGFKETAYSQSIPVLIQTKAYGKVTLYYLTAMDKPDEQAAMNEDHLFVKGVVDRIKYFIVVRDATQNVRIKKRGDWEVILDLIATTNSSLLLLITKKMLHRLCLSGNKEAQQLMKKFDKDSEEERNTSFGDTNVPLKKKDSESLWELKNNIFELASRSFPDKLIFSLIERWMHQHNARFLVEALGDESMSLGEVIDAISQYQRILPRGVELPQTTKRQVVVSFIKRFLTYDLKYRRIAKNFFELEDFEELLSRVIAPRGSHGRLGGKAAGLFLAQKIIQKKAEEGGIPDTIKMPKTWYMTSGCIDTFIHWNSLGDLIEHKYKSHERLRQEYPHIIQVFKDSSFPPELVNGLSRALDDLHDGPLVVRSSSLLEDSFEAAFAGKYKSLFLANQGTKEERLVALMDAISEIYASVFAPDPVIYRCEKELLDFCEAMGIMIQEVVGKKVENYFFPPYAGVAFSNNEFRWSRRIKKDDGLVRLVPGLGTRAVDRLGDDYPILVSPGQPGLRVNVTTEEKCRYCPQKIDVINMNNNQLETLPVNQLFEHTGLSYPQLKRVVSIVDGDQVKSLSGLTFDENDFIVTFESLFTETPFLETMNKILTILKEEFEFPIDIEFAHNGDHLYLLQCRPQSHSEANVSSPIPKDIPSERMIFSASRYVSNGLVPDISHIVYVDPEGYSKLPSVEALMDVGKAVGLLNQSLPRRKFILMGPGRWGSRGDIKLGVRVCYSDINNTAVLIEVARKKGNYTPELSFGTHFFQDLVEANIRYLPLYPDKEENAFNEKFLSESNNLLSEILPQYAHLNDVIKVIDVPKSSGGQHLKILLNSDLDQAVAFLSASNETNKVEPVSVEQVESRLLENRGDWNWRMFMARMIASNLDPKQFGVKGFYIFGSTKNHTASDGSDINILIHFNGNKTQRHELELWLSGWSQALNVVNYLKSGNKEGGKLDVHVVTDKDIEEKNSYATKIGAVTDPARPLPMKKS